MYKETEITFDFFLKTTGKMCWMVFTFPNERVLRNFAIFNLMSFLLWHVLEY